MASPIPKPAAQRQRTNRHVTAAVLEANPAVRVSLPPRLSPWRCAATVDRKAGCPLDGVTHDLDHFAKAEVEPHVFVPIEVPWHPMTVRWWETIWASPMVGEWVDADVSDLLAIAALWDEFWNRGDPRTHAEIRLASREFGLSPLSRRQLQWEIRRVQAATPAVPAAPRRRGKAILAALDGGKARSA